MKTCSNSTLLTGFLESSLLVGVKKESNKQKPSN